MLSYSNKFDNTQAPSKGAARDRFRCPSSPGKARGICRRSAPRTGTTASRASTSIPAHRRRPAPIRRRSRRSSPRPWWRGRNGTTSSRCSAPVFGARDSGLRGRAGGGRTAAELEADSARVHAQRSPNLNAIASNGRTLTGSSSFAHAISTHSPSRNSNASSVRSAGSMSQRCVTPTRAQMGRFSWRSIRRVDGESTSHAQSGARVKYAVSGGSGIRSRRQPPRSGTTMPSRRCGSGSLRIHQPPGPSRPRWKGGLSSPPKDRACDRVRWRWSWMGMERAVDALGYLVRGCVEHVLTGRLTRRQGSRRDAAMSSLLFRVLILLPHAADKVMRCAGPGDHPAHLSIGNREVVLTTAKTGCSRVGTLAPRLRHNGSPPACTKRRFSSAASRAALRVTIGYPPRPGVRRIRHMVIHQRQGLRGDEGGCAAAGRERPAMSRIARDQLRYPALMSMYAWVRSQVQMVARPSPPTPTSARRRTSDPSRCSVARSSE